MVITENGIIGQVSLGLNIGCIIKIRMVNMVKVSFGLKNSKLDFFSWICHILDGYMSIGSFIKSNNYSDSEKYAELILENLWQKSK